ncbi:hypothetical protein Q5H92_26345 [Hymenobacter sp. M29]|uniref:DUF4468 domain-containing protein n=1 Tax=Hymenobacter mellowenesis TaxID=3063995 RepID=A0ABT9ALK6_9BACT|nr:hypothetical protein [Hymenobacter sp. M29]MDO7849907.1 hypothetical protein [Hymenobacter sp. M29]
MKTPLAALLCLLTLTTHAQEWPRNPKTGKVEFTGVLPWPTTTKTDAQRQALVKRWYLAKLTDSTPAQVAEEVRTMVSKSLLTYAQLPTITAIEQGKEGEGYRLLYMVKLTSAKAGLSYSISDFTLAKRSDEDSTPLEHHLTTPDTNKQAALAELRKRLVKALSAF